MKRLFKQTSNGNDFSELRAYKCQHPNTLPIESFIENKLKMKKILNSINN